MQSISTDLRKRKILINRRLFALTRKNSLQKIGIHRVDKAVSVYISRDEIRVCNNVIINIHYAAVRAVVAGGIKSVVAGLLGDKIERKITVVLPYRAPNHLSERAEYRNKRCRL